MALSTRTIDAIPGEASPPATQVRRSRITLGATFVVGGALGVVVAHDGEPMWILIRLVVVGAATVAAIRTELASGPRLRDLTALATGVLGLAVGIGIGLPHLVKDGPALMTSTGLAALGAGLVLWIAGAVGLLRGARGWWRVPVGGAILVATSVALWAGGQALAATNVVRTDVGSTTPSDRGLEYFDVTFRTSDGVELSGWYVPGGNGAAVVLIHGAGSTRSSVLDHAVVLAERGHGVLLFDARGHGRSGGRAMDFGWYGDEDVAAAVGFVAEQPGVDDHRIAVVGMSMGAEEAIGAAASEERIAAVVAEGATNRTAADKAWLSQRYGWRGALQEGVERLVYGVADLLTDASPPESLRGSAMAADRPMLLIAAGTVTDEVHAANHIRSGAPDDVEVWVAEGAGHTEALSADPDAWRARVGAFLDETISGPRP